MAPKQQARRTTLSTLAADSCVTRRDGAPLPPWAAFVALALFCPAFGSVLSFRLIANSGATNALLVTLLVPPVAILLGALFLNETLAPQDFIGLGLIALGLAAIDGRLLNRLSAPRRLPREA